MGLIVSKQLTKQNKETNENFQVTLSIKIKIKPEWEEGDSQRLGGQRILTDER